ncbi:methyltransferase domain-containing protein [Niveibacterium sp. SC-1]|uniref:methyltransferase domain-containing protein n=1 Tax=Niveibacterium sp. SC-1 TaxID=3135646 RepID=UPI00311F9971
MSISGFAEWLESPLGQYLIAWEQSHIDGVVADIFGFHALQVGLPQVEYLRENRIGSRFRCCKAVPGGFLADAHALPIASQSVDLVVLPHVLEFSAHPHQVLREVERVLVPEGQVVLAGFNPLSLWGARRYFAGTDGEMPWQGQFLASRRLRDWLQLLGFDVVGSECGAYIPPVTQARWIERWRFMDDAGGRWWPIAGGAYVIQAVKRVQGMRLIAPAWRDRRAKAKKLAPVVQQEAAPIKHNKRTQ